MYVYMLNVKQGWYQAYVTYQLAHHVHVWENTASIT